MAARVHHIGIAVPSLEKATKFFYEVFGVGSSEVESKDVKNMYIQFENLSIQVCEDPLRLDGAPFGRLDHIALQLDDLDETTVKLKANGVNMVWDPPVKLRQYRSNFTKADGGVGVVFQLSDELAATREGQEWTQELQDKLGED